MSSTAQGGSARQNLRWKLILLLVAFALVRPIAGMTGLAGEGAIAGVDRSHACHLTRNLQLQLLGTLYYPQWRSPPLGA